MGLCLEKDQVKPLEAVDGALMEYHGWAVVRISYQGQQTQTRPLVTLKLRNKIILSRDLVVITEDFPNVIIKERRPSYVRKNPLTRGANRISLQKNGANRKNLLTRGANCKSPLMRGVNYKFHQMQVEME